MKPDGTGQQVYFGNQVPGGVFIDGQPIPGTSNIVSITSPGHGQNEHAGNVTIASEAGGDGPREDRLRGNEGDMGSTPHGGDTMRPYIL
jgi:hypothetical protein